MNLNAKVFAKLSNNQSLYFKVSGQSEDNQASLSSQTPFTFDTDPTQNPFLDADQFTMRRYGLDIIHKWLPTKNLSFTSKGYASDFERDWWQQTTAKSKASEVQTYVGDAIFNDRYSYLDVRTFGEEDYVIVGRIDNGRESTTDGRWTYTVSGVKETMDYQWNAFEKEQHLEASINLHRETFKDRFLFGASSRWAGSGRATTDLWYHLWSANGFVRNEFNIDGTKEGKEPSVYTQFLPGITLDYLTSYGEFMPVSMKE